MKKIISFMLIVLLVSSICICPVYANEKISVYLDDKQIQFDVDPIMINDRTLVPMRAIFEELGATVAWDNETNTAYAYKQMKGLSITIGAPYMYDLNFTSIPLDVPAVLKNDRTLVPLRAVSEFFNCNVQWDDKTSTVNIYTQGFIDFGKEESTQTTVKVATTYELLNNIGNNKHIILTSDYYNLSEVDEINNSCIQKQLYSDGYTIKNVVNMTIEGNAQISIDDIYADVLQFENCGKITLDGLTVGHTEPLEEYRCEGSVLTFSYCQDVTVKNCNLYGCGAIGLNVNNSSDILMEETNIYDCSFSGLYFYVSDNITVNKCNIHDNSFFGPLCYLNSSTTVFNDCIIENNSSDKDWAFIETYDILDNFDSNSQATWNNCKFIDNSFDYFISPYSKNVLFNNCEFSENTGNMEYLSEN